MLLEGLAARHGPVDALRAGWQVDNGILDLLPLAAQLADETDATRGAATFHATLIDALADWCVGRAREHRLGVVVLGGGCFNNRILAQGLRRRLEVQQLDVLEARQAPPNDGGLALGQAWIGGRMLANLPLH